VTWLRVEGHDAIAADQGMSILEACERAGVPIGSDCGGFAACNACRVRVLEGAEHLSELLPEEEPFLDDPAQRLGCQACVLGDVRVRFEPGA
jgi:adenylate cyclase